MDGSEVVDQGQPVSGPASSLQGAILWKLMLIRWEAVPWGSRCHRGPECSISSSLERTQTMRQRKEEGKVGWQRQKCEKQRQKGAVLLSCWGVSSLLPRWRHITVFRALGSEPLSGLWAELCSTSKAQRGLYCRCLQSPDQLPCDSAVIVYPTLPLGEGNYLRKTKEDPVYYQQESLTHSQ